MGKLSSATFALALTLSFTSSADARSIEDVRLSADARDLVLELRSDEALTRPTVKTSAGQVRVLFADTAVSARHKLASQTSELTQIDLRQSSSGAAVLRLKLKERTTLAKQAVRVERRHGTTTLRIARELLAGRGARAAEPVSPANVQAAAPAPTSVSTPEAPAQTQTAKRLAVGEGLQTERSMMPMLLTVSLFLGLAYGLMRLWMRKHTPIAAPAIHVVAEKRLGARHQLVIVRAFGRDHLLSIQGNTTTAIATEPAPEHDCALDDAEPVSSLPKSTKPLGTTTKAAPPSDRVDTTFGGELLKLAIAQRSAEAKQTSAAASETVKGGMSKAVSGLVRLRREAGL